MSTTESTDIPPVEITNPMLNSTIKEESTLNNLIFTTETTKNVINTTIGASKQNELVSSTVNTAEMSSQKTDTEVTSPDILSTTTEMDLGTHSTEISSNSASTSSTMTSEASTMVHSTHNIQVVSSSSSSLSTEGKDENISGIASVATLSTSINGDRTTTLEGTTFYNIDKISESITSTEDTIQGKTTLSFTSVSTIFDRKLIHQKQRFRFHDDEYNI